MAETAQVEVGIALRTADIAPVETEIFQAATEVVLEMVDIAQDKVDIVLVGIVRAATEELRVSRAVFA